jgi:hypothetical protein
MFAVQGPWPSTVSPLPKQQRQSIFCLLLIIFKSNYSVLLRPKTRTAAVTTNPKLSTLHVWSAADFVVAELEALLVEEALLTVVAVEPLDSSLMPTMLTPVLFTHDEPESRVAVLLNVISAH